MPCLEIEDDVLVIVGRHRERTMRERRHVNRIPLTDLLEYFAEEMDSRDLDRIIFQALGRERLTDLLKKK